MQDKHAKDNAFNRYNDASYQYQTPDINCIGNQIINELAQDNIHFIGVLGKGENADVISAKAYFSRIKESVDRLKNGVFVGVYNTGGNHWIAFAITSQGVEYKDSLGSTKIVDFEDEIKKVFGEDVKLHSHKGKEQLDGVSCGLFALNNMQTLAINISDNLQSKPVFYNPSTEAVGYEKSIEHLRRSYAIKYAEHTHGQVKELLNDRAYRQEVCKLHANEVDKLRKIISDRTAIDDVKIEVRTLPDTRDKYLYAIECNVTDIGDMTEFISNISGNIFEVKLKTNDILLFLVLSNQIQQNKSEELFELIEGNSIQLVGSIQPDMQLIEQDFIQALNITTEIDSQFITDLTKHITIDLTGKRTYLQPSSPSKDSITNETQSDIHAEKNAFNQYTDTKYLYQGTDINAIGEQILSDLNDLNIQFTGALGRGHKLLDIKSHLQLFRDDIQKGKKIIGIYNAGGNHWIAFAVTSQGVEYKDSLGSMQVMDFENDIKEVLGENIHFYPYEGREQLEVVNCGLFALQNMYAFAIRNNPQNKPVFYNPSTEAVGYEKSIENLRRSYAIKYVEYTLGQVRKVLTDRAYRQEVCKLHINEVEWLKTNLKGKLIDCEVRTLSNNPKNYVYYLSFTPENYDIILKVVIEFTNEQYQIVTLAKNKVALTFNAKDVQDNKTEGLFKLIQDNAILEPANSELDQIQLEKEFIQALNYNKKVDAQLILAIQDKTGINLTGKESQTQAIKVIDKRQKATLGVYSNDPSLLTKEIERLIDLFLAYECKLKENSISQQDILDLKEILFRISWRVSEISSFYKFNDKSPYIHLFTEKTWVMLDYLADTINNQWPTQYPKMFESILEPLVKDFILAKQAFQNLLDKKTNKDLAVSQLNLENVNSFVGLFLDKKLLTKLNKAILQLLQSASISQDHNDFLADEINQYAILRVLEILGECAKNISYETKNQDLVIPWLAEDKSEANSILSKIRNSIIHKRSGIALLIKYDIELFKQIIRQALPDIQLRIECFVKALNGKVEEQDLQDFFSFKQAVYNKVHKNTSVLEVRSITAFDQLNNQLDHLSTKNIGKINKLLKFITPGKKSEIAKLLFNICTLKSTDEFEQLIQQPEILLEKEITQESNNRANIIRDLSYLYRQARNRWLHNYEIKALTSIKSALSFTQSQQDILEILGGRKQCKMAEDFVSVLKNLIFIRENSETKNKEIDTASEEKLLEFFRLSKVSNIDEASISSLFYPQDEIIKKKINENRLKLLEESNNLKQLIIQWLNFPNDRAPCDKKKLDYLPELSDEQRIKIFDCLDKIRQQGFNKEEKVKIAQIINPAFAELIKPTNKASSSDKKSIKKTKEEVAKDKELSDGFTNQTKEILSLPTVNRKESLASLFPSLDNGDIDKLVKILLGHDEEKESLKHEVIGLLNLVPGTIEIYNQFQKNAILQLYKILLNQDQTEIQNVDKEFTNLLNSLCLYDFSDETVMKSIAQKLNNYLSKLQGNQQNPENEIKEILKRAVSSHEVLSETLENESFLGMAPISQSIFGALVKKLGYDYTKGWDKLLEKIKFRNILGKSNPLREELTTALNFYFESNAVDSSLFKEFVQDAGYTYDMKWETLFNKIVSAKQLKVEPNQKESIASNNDELVQNNQSSQDGIIQSFLKDLEKLSSIFDQLISTNLATTDKTTQQKGLLYLAAQYLVQDLGQKGEFLVQDVSYKDSSFLSISKRNFHLLSIIRRAIAHYPLEVDDCLLEYYLNQMVMEAKVKLEDRLMNLDLKDVLQNTNFCSSKEVTLEELVQKEAELFILIEGLGFKSDFKIFGKQFNCDFGVQGDLNLLVEFGKDALISNDSIIELEIRLSNLFNANVKVYRASNISDYLGLKVLPIHLERITTSALYIADVIMSYKFKQILEEGNWSNIRFIDGNEISRSDYLESRDIEDIFSFLLDGKATYEKVNAILVKGTLKELIETKTNSYNTSPKDKAGDFRLFLYLIQNCFPVGPYQLRGVKLPIHPDHTPSGKIEYKFMPLIIEEGVNGEVKSLDQLPEDLSQEEFNQLQPEVQKFYYQYSWTKENKTINRYMRCDTLFAIDLGLTKEFKQVGRIQENAAYIEHILLKNKRYILDILSSNKRLDHINYFEITSIESGQTLKDYEEEKIKSRELIESRLREHPIIDGMIKKKAKAYFGQIKIELDKLDTQDRELFLKLIHIQKKMDNIIKDYYLEHEAEITFLSRILDRSQQQVLNNFQHRWTDILPDQILYQYNNSLEIFNKHAREFSFLIKDASKREQLLSLSETEYDILLVQGGIMVDKVIGTANRTRNSILKKYLEIFTSVHNPEIVNALIGSNVKFEVLEILIYKDLREQYITSGSTTTLYHLSGKKQNQVMTDFHAEVEYDYKLYLEQLQSNLKEKISKTSLPTILLDLLAGKFDLNDQHHVLVFEKEKALIQKQVGLIYPKIIDIHNSRVGTIHNQVIHHCIDTQYVVPIVKLEDFVQYVNENFNEQKDLIKGIQNSSKSTTRYNNKVTNLQELMDSHYWEASERIDYINYNEDDLEIKNYYEYINQIRALKALVNRLKKYKENIAALESKLNEKTHSYSKIALIRIGEELGITKLAYEKGLVKQNQLLEKVLNLKFVDQMCKEALKAPVVLLRLINEIEKCQINERERKTQELIAKEFFRIKIKVRDEIFEQIGIQNNQILENQNGVANTALISEKDLNKDTSSLNEMRTKSVSTEMTDYKKVLNYILKKYIECFDSIENQRIRSQGYQDIFVLHGDLTELEMNLKQAERIFKKIMKTEVGVDITLTITPKQETTGWAVILDGMAIINRLMKLIRHSHLYSLSEKIADDTASKRDTLGRSDFNNKTPEDNGNQLENTVDKFILENNIKDKLLDSVKALLFQIDKTDSINLEINHLFEKALEDSADNPTVFLIIGLCYKKINLPAEAKKMFDHCIKESLDTKEGRRIKALAKTELTALTESSRLLCSIQSATTMEKATNINSTYTVNNSIVATPSITISTNVIAATTTTNQQIKIAQARNKSNDNEKT